ncbi:MAG: hypothetical protein GTO54_03090, partial [Nitrososphaeria archaeon]|nr:hypothetical protein [Nitrososphaeria archaeon]
WLRALHDKFHSPERPFKAVVIAPRGTLRGAWANDLEKFVPELDYVVLSGSSDSKKKTIHKSFTVKSKNKDYAIYLINPESIIPRRTRKGKTPGIVDDLIQMQPSAVIVDESSKMKNPRSSTTKAILKLCDSGPRFRMVMSG